MTVGFKHPTRALVSSHIATPSATVSTRLIRSAFFISGLLIAMLVSGKSGAVQAIDLPDFEGLVACSEQRHRDNGRTARPT